MSDQSTESGSSTAGAEEETPLGKSILKWIGIYAIALPVTFIGVGIVVAVTLSTFK